jgi:hypothetical protein
MGTIVVIVKCASRKVITSDFINTMGSVKRSGGPSPQMIYKTKSPAEFGDSLMTLCISYEAVWYCEPFVLYIIRLLWIALSLPNFCLKVRAVAAGS